MDLPWLADDSSLHLLDDTQISHYRELMTRAHRVRAQRRMAVGSLAWVTGVPWADSNVFVQVGSHTVTVLNTSTHDVTVPMEMTPLLSSERLKLDPDEADSYRVTPGECAWFVAAEH